MFIYKELEQLPQTRQKTSDGLFFVRGPATDGSWAFRSIGHAWCYVTPQDVVESSWYSGRVRTVRMAELQAFHSHVVDVSDMIDPKEQFDAMMQKPAIDASLAKLSLF